MYCPEHFLSLKYMKVYRRGYICNLQSSFGQHFICAQSFSVILLFSLHFCSSPESFLSQIFFSLVASSLNDCLLGLFPSPYSAFVYIINVFKAVSPICSQCKLYSRSLIVYRFISRSICSHAKGLLFRTA